METKARFISLKMKKIKGEYYEKIIVVSLAAFAFLTTNASASEGVQVNKYVNTETYPEGNTLENDLKKEKEYLKEIFDFDFDLDTSYELSKKMVQKLIFIQKIAS